MKIKFLIVLVSLILAIFTFSIPGLYMLWSSSGFFEVWTFWLVILIFFIYIKREEK